MMQKKKPAGQGRTFKTGRGGDPINRKKNMAENDIIVKPCHAFAGLKNILIHSNASQQAEIMEDQSQSPTDYLTPSPDRAKNGLRYLYIFR